MSSVCPEDLSGLLGEFEHQASATPLHGDLGKEAERVRQVLVIGVSIALSIDLIDNNWRTAVLSGVDEYDPGQEEQILEYHRNWLRGSDEIAPRLDRLESLGIEVKWSSQFRRLYREAKALLTPDDQYFSGDALVRLRDEAIDAHREGRTAEFHELGD